MLTDASLPSLNVNQPLELKFCLLILSCESGMGISKRSTYSARDFLIRFLKAFPYKVGRQNRIDGERLYDKLRMFSLEDGRKHPSVRK